MRMKIKDLMLKVFGEKKYLFLLSNGFQVLFHTGGLSKEYADVYFLRRYIRPGDWCIDIGAHLGYFTVELSRLVKPGGRVFAVEPMSKFNRVLQRLTALYRLRNVTVYPVALGGQGDYVEMGIPEIGRQKRYAYARVMSSNPGLQYIDSERVANKRGDDLFGGLTRLDFVKCDVEGLEFAVLSSMIGTIRAHLPILLCEFFDRGERIKLYELLRPLGYEAYDLVGRRWRGLDVYAEGQMISQNNYFIPAGRREALSGLFE
jgi:FkbM family methyltransferase